MAGVGPGSERGTGNSRIPGKKGKHIWRTLASGGGGGKPRGGVVGRAAVGVAGLGGGGGEMEKTGNGLGGGNRTRDALQSMEIL